MIGLEDARVAVLGMGHVGLPLCVALSKRYQVTGFDIQTSRIEALSRGQEAPTVTSAEGCEVTTGICFSSNPKDLARCNVYIVAVPTPVDEAKKPDLGPLLAASHTVGQVISPGDVVIYESTVYPGATEEDCIPVIERVSGLTYRQDFFAGYSPERINPGDTAHGLSVVKKVTSGSDTETAAFVDALYGSIISAGTHLAPSIRVAEAAKVIENTQRDVNIALINEFAMIFDQMQIDTLDVLEAAETKWNYHSFRPGLVGGHCIGVDPYYLAHKALALGHHPRMLLSGRSINDDMAPWLAKRLIQRMVAKDMPVRDGTVLVLGLTYKADVPDISNTRVVDLKTELESHGMQVDVHDPLVSPEEVIEQFGFRLSESNTRSHDTVILAVPHRVFLDGGPEDVTRLCANAALVFDLNGVLPRAANTLRV